MRIGNKIVVELVQPKPKQKSERGIKWTVDPQVTSPIGQTNEDGASDWPDAVTPHSSTNVAESETEDSNKKKTNPKKAHTRTHYTQEHIHFHARTYDIPQACTHSTHADSAHVRIYVPNTLYNTHTQNTRGPVPKKKKKKKSYTKAGTDGKPAAASARRHNMDHCAQKLRKGKKERGRKKKNIYIQWCRKHRTNGAREQMDDQKQTSYTAGGNEKSENHRRAPIQHNETKVSGKNGIHAHMHGTREHSHNIHIAHT